MIKENYQSGFGNHFSTEALPGALPADQNSPQMAPLGLYAEQLSGSAFTVQRGFNLYSWLYRVRPSVMQGRFQREEALTLKSFAKAKHLDPNQMRWNPMTALKGNFLEGLRTVASSGSGEEQKGIQILLYSFTESMKNNFFMNADGDFVIVPQLGRLEVRTELGRLEVEPGEIALVPRGIKFQVNSLDGKPCSGYIGENFGQPFRLPELGPIGANGLAHRRHFLVPVASFEDIEGEFKLYGKFGGEVWSASLGHSPLDVVAWHGTYTPYKYDLRKFNTINTVSFDHPDPCIFTVLTSPSDTPGMANIDFVIFPPRWMTAENTFRPPYFHRNIMSEYMGLIYGDYDAKTGGGFVPGGGSLHNFFSAHGPDVKTFETASHAELKPQKLDATMAFMFESRYPYKVTDMALEKDFLQGDYQDCWQGFHNHFKK